MLRNIRDYVVDLEAGRSPSPGKVIRNFLFDVNNSYSFLDNVTEISIVDDGHPLGLGNPQILRCIFQNLTNHDLISLRRVNLRWNHIACETLRRDLDYCKLRPSRIKSFLKMMKHSFENPFSSYAIRIEWHKDPCIKKFLKRFSKSVINLRVTIASREIPEFINILHDLPLLERLHLLRIPDEYETFRQEYLSNPIWQHGVYRFPNLREITFENENPSLPFIRSYDNCLIDLINTSPNLVSVQFINWDSKLAQLFSRCRIRNPKCLDTGLYFCSQLLEDLNELFFKKGMKFKALRFSIDDHNKLDLPLVKKYIQECSETLYHLSLKNVASNGTLTLPTACPHLLTLGLKHWHGAFNFADIGLKFCHLQTLIINRENLSGVERLFPENNRDDVEIGVSKTEPNTALLELETLIILPPCPKDIDPVDSKLIKCITKLFPNIKKLFVQVDDNDSLHTIYKSWPHLTTLSLDLGGDNLTDEGLTGIPESSVNISGSHQCGCPRMSFPEENRRSTNIGNLSDLTELIIKSRTRLTNVAILEGISYLNNLTKLWLLAVEQEEGTVERKWCLKAIADSFKNLRYLATGPSSLYSQEEVVYIMDKIPNLELEHTNYVKT